MAGRCQMIQQTHTHTPMSTFTGMALCAIMPNILPPDVCPQQTHTHTTHTPSVHYASNPLA